jgi:hypothetical protein
MNIRVRADPALQQRPPEPSDSKRKRKRKQSSVSHLPCWPQTTLGPLMSSAKGTRTSHRLAGAPASHSPSLRIAPGTIEATRARVASSGVRWTTEVGSKLCHGRRRHQRRSGQCDLSSNLIATLCRTCWRQCRMPMHVRGCVGVCTPCCVTRTSKWGVDFGDSVACRWMSGTVWVCGACML